MNKTHSQDDCSTRKRLISPKEHVQNPPMTVKEFQKYCKKLGLKTNSSELERYEKLDLLCPYFYENEDQVKKHYFNYQIIFLEEIKRALRISLDLRGCEIIASSHVPHDTIEMVTSFTVNSIQQFDEEVSQASAKSNYRSEVINEAFHFDSILEQLRTRKEEFENVLNWLLKLDLYYPYAKSGAGQIISRGGEIYFDQVRGVNNKAVCHEAKVNLDDIASWYMKFSTMACEMGIKTWTPLFNSVFFQKKDALSGSPRKAIEYLQWAYMLKRFLEDSLDRKLLEPDETLKLRSPEELLDTDLENDKVYARSLRGVRNRDYGDYYYDRFKRNLFQANEFGFNHQPKVILFVEGKTEEILIPKIFHAYFGDKIENHGIQIMNLAGIDNLFGGKKNVSNLYHLITMNLNNWQIFPFFILDNENKILDSIKAGKMLAYNGADYCIPEAWYFIWGESNLHSPLQGKDFEMANFSDDEIATALSKVLRKFPTRGEITEAREKSSGIQPFIDSSNSHELALLSNEFFGESISYEQILNCMEGKTYLNDLVGHIEDSVIAKNLKKTLGIDVAPPKIKKCKTGKKKGLNRLIRLCKIGVGLKIKIAELLVEELFANHSLDSSELSKRPIISALKKVEYLARLNHRPTDIHEENINRERIIEILKPYVFQRKKHKKPGTIGPGNN